MGVLATSKISMSNGQSCRADEIKAGDILQDGSTIQYVLESDAVGEKLSMVSMVSMATEPLVISNWHPILIGGCYQFPANCSSSAYICTDSTRVFSFLTDTGRDIVVNGISCVALAHGSDMHPLKHYFFGTGRVQRAMLKLQPDSRGKVVCSRFVRHAVDGFVTDMY